MFKGRKCRSGPLWPLQRYYSTLGWPRRATPTVVAFVALILAGSQARANQPPVVSVLDFGSSAMAKQATDTLRTKLRVTGEVASG